MIFVSIKLELPLETMAYHEQTLASLKQVKVLNTADTL